MHSPLCVFMLAIWAASAFTPGALALWPRAGRHDLHPAPAVANYPRALGRHINPAKVGSIAASTLTEKRSSPLPWDEAAALEKRERGEGGSPFAERAGVEDGCDEWGSPINMTTVSVQGSCYPALTLEHTPPIPSVRATASSLSHWWCPDEVEYAWQGFSYDVSDCLPRADLTRDFTWMKNVLQARYVRIYGVCDANTFNDDLVDAAAAAGLGVYALIWFGFDGDDKWKTRMDRMIRTVNNNAKAPYVIRNVALGSEPLFDSVLSADELAVQLTALRKAMESAGVPVTISEMPSGYQMNRDSPSVFSAVQSVSLNVLPFFDAKATTGDRAWGVVSWAVSYAKQHGLGKKVTITQTGWPSNTAVWAANSKHAVASIAQEKAYYDLLDSRCTWFKSQNVGWFSHVFDDDTLPGWGILDGSGQRKFNFAPRTHC